MTILIPNCLRTGRGAALALAATLTACGGDVSLQDEAEMGDSYAAEILREVRVIRDPAAEATLKRLGGQLVAKADSTGREYTFYLVDSPEVNAFAIPGGHVFVNTGLIETADEASEFAGVLGHEIAHVTERHGIEQMKKRGRANILVTLVYTVLGRDPGQLERVAIEAGGAAVFAKHGREAEREADLRAVQTLPAAGYDPEGVATFFEQMLEQQTREPGLLDTWFASHPTSQERVQNARTLIGTLNVDRSRLTDDTPEYQAFRARVQKLSGAAAQAQAR
ncbi:M48 family metallopeptidase [Longimicrobium terrae]|uniref:Putative Zn-dependent protease n=1 Tax=Longimicrobium terrae TaxID=1639882 RepID=A0A841GMC2_9BACT|nr:M48 family metallopeptidase [Longimicrobium terrae]MBB4635373.1 putative Zn-dependent protease [Longimicrobium terrae]MBB6069767.1 putative Zn-dependent protease [Longimicrobium terrae]NNC31022.1 M48 family metalloprotease [Longimicrobium terrae]